MQSLYAYRFYALRWFYLKITVSHWKRANYRAVPAHTEKYPIYTAFFQTGMLKIVVQTMKTGSEMRIIIRLHCQTSKYFKTF